MVVGFIIGGGGKEREVNGGKEKVYFFGTEVVFSLF